MDTQEVNPECNELSD